MLIVIMTNYLDREISARVREALEDMPVVVLTGMRQCGKSTFLRNDSALKRRRYVSLDNFAELEGIRKNPEQFLGAPDPITIDEAQHFPGLMNAIKVQVDRENHLSGRFLLSGSANFALLKGVSESLAGRAAYLEMLPFTRREIEGNLQAEPFLKSFFRSPVLPRRLASRPVTPEEILRGGMPRVALGGVRRSSAWFDGYEKTYVERDVRQLSQIADLFSFRKVVRLAALRTGKILKISELARDAQISVPTLTRYLGVMETSCILQRIPPYLDNPAARLIKSPKIYVLDSGIAAHLAGVKDVSPASDELLRGAIIETYVAQNIAAILAARWPGANLSFWNVQGRHEVDFVISEGRDCIAIEVKAASRWNDRDLSGLRTFLSLMPQCRAAILAHGGTTAVSLGDRLFAVPMDVLIG